LAEKLTVTVTLVTVPETLNPEAVFLRINVGAQAFASAMAESAGKPDAVLLYATARIVVNALAVVSLAESLQLDAKFHFPVPLAMLGIGASCLCMEIVAVKLLVCVDKQENIISCTAARAKRFETPASLMLE